MKQELRQAIIDKRNTLSPEMVADKSHQISQRVLNMNLIKPGDTVLLFMDFRNEVRTKELIEYVLRIGRLILPKVDMKTKVMTLHIIDDLTHLKRSKYGILEPTNQPTVEAHALDVILSPGVAFDANKYRLGYGGGFYDRLLQTIDDKVPVVALAFECQMVDQVPIEAHDKPVDFIVTESRIID